jgi:mannitol-1-phosphate 5-dehydrogenase
VQQALIFGAGNIGRGFIGQLFSQSGYQVTFADIDAPLIALFNERHQYRLEMVFNEQRDVLQIGPVNGLLATDREAVAAAVAQATIAATAVGARALPAVAAVLALGIARRAAAGAPPFNLIVCENLKHAAAHLRELVTPHLPAAARPYFDEQVGFVDTVIGRMVPMPTPEQRAADPGLVIVEPYQELPVERAAFRGPIPKVVAMQPVDNFPVYTARKLYLHNCGHALFAYRGYLAGFEYGYEALADRTIRDFLFAGWEEAVAGIVHHYQADPQWLRAHMDDLYRRFQNRALGDTVFRLARDPVRKLHPSDRLVSPARLAEQTGRTPQALAAGIAAALRFDAAADPVAVELQARIARAGLPAVLAEVCQIRADEPLGQAVVSHYQQLAPRS